MSQRGGRAKLSKSPSRRHNRSPARQLREGDAMAVTQARGRRRSLVADGVFSGLIVKVVSATDLVPRDSNGKSDPFIKISISDGKTDRSNTHQKTTTKKKTLDPTWNEQFEWPSQHLFLDDVILFKVRDHTTFGHDEKEGWVTIPFVELAAETGPVTRELKLHDLPQPKGRGHKDSYDSSITIITEVVSDEEFNWNEQASTGAKASEMAGLHLTLSSADNLPPPAGMHLHLVDSYVKITVGTVEKKSKIVRDNSNPHWDESFFFDFAALGSVADVHIEFEIYDHCTFGSDRLIASHVCPFYKLVLKREGFGQSYVLLHTHAPDNPSYMTFDSKVILPEATREDWLANSQALFQSDLERAPSNPGDLDEKHPSRIQLLDSVRGLVSKKKTRFQVAGFDLDLTYIGHEQRKNCRFIAMGIPCEGMISGMYRNSATEVKDFFHHFHNGRFKVYNLCSEDFSQYDGVAMFGEDRYTADYVGPDHHPPAFEAMIGFARDADEFLKTHAVSVVAAHCKAGKGRTGTQIAAALIYCGMQPTADAALNNFGKARTSNNKGVTIPSQQLYVRYMQEFMTSPRFEAKDGSRQLGEAPEVQLTSLTLNGRPDMELITDGCNPYIIVHQEEKAIYHMKKLKKKILAFRGGGEAKDATFTITLDPPLAIKGNIKVVFKDKAMMGDHAMFHTHFHTSFIHKNSYTLPKANIDKACKDKHSEVYPESFSLTINFDGISDEMQYPDDVKDCHDTFFIRDLDGGTHPDDPIDEDQGYPPPRKRAMTTHGATKSVEAPEDSPTAPVLDGVAEKTE